MTEAWSAAGGGPADLTFPDAFLGTWACTSTLLRVDTPLGLQAVQDPAVVARAEATVGRSDVFPLRFLRNGKGEVILVRGPNSAGLSGGCAAAAPAGATGARPLLPRRAAQDRPFNTLALAAAAASPGLEVVEWDPDNPNSMRLRSADGRGLFTRVTRRFQEAPSPGRLTTSEVVEQAGAARLRRLSTARPGAGAS